MKLQLADGTKFEGTMEELTSFIEQATKLTAIQPAPEVAISVSPKVVNQSEVHKAVRKALAKSFKKGDYLKVLSVCGGEFDTKEGDIVEVQDSGVDFVWYKVIRNGHTSGMYADRFEKTAAPKKAEMFKVGDYAKVVSEEGPWHSFKNGDVVKILIVDGSGWQSIKGKRTTDGETQWLTEEQVKRIEKPEAKKVAPKSKFAVGDYIKGLGGRYSITTEKMTRGKVVEVLTDGRIRVEVLEHTKYPEDIGTVYTVEEKYFEKIEPTKIKVGDHVKIVAERCGHRFSIGEVVKITGKSDRSYKAWDLADTDYWYVYDDEIEFVGTPVMETVVVETAKEEAPKFKKGDKVILKNGGGDHPLYGFQNGKEYEIDATPDEHQNHEGMNYFRLFKPSGVHGYAKADKLELVASKPEGFKVGDKVKVVTDNPKCGWGRVTKGDVGTITKVDGKSIKVEFPLQKHWSGFADEFELVVEELVQPVETVQPEPTFKVGDKVKVVSKKGIGFYCIPVGTVGTVIGYSNQHPHSRVRIEVENKHTQYIDNIDLELFVETKVESPFKVGDVVRAINPSKYGAAEGKLVTVTEVYTKGEHDEHTILAKRVDPSEPQNNLLFKVTDLAFEVPAEKVASRKAVIAQAKADVASLLKRNYRAWEHDLSESVYLVVDYADSVEDTTDEIVFEVNREKRTVVAKIRYTGSKRVWRTGVARCTADDVFNVEIGKAIALRRALNQTVPTEYTDAPVPTEIEVGQTVLWKDTDSVYLITEVRGGDRYSFRNVDTEVDFKGYHYEDLLQHVTIIAD